MWTLVLMLLVLVTLRARCSWAAAWPATSSGLIGLGDTAATVWRIARWPAALLSAMLIYAIVYYAAPNVEVRHWQYITPGAVFGVGAVDPRVGRLLHLRVGLLVATRRPMARSPLS